MGFHFNYQDAPKDVRPTREDFRRISRYLLPEWRPSALILGCILVTSLLGLVPPLLIKEIIDRAIPRGDSGLLNWLVAGMIGLPLIDDDNREFAQIVDVVRTPEGKVRLIASYGRWFGWFGRNVSVPIEVVAIVGKQVASLDMQPDEYRTAPTWAAGRDSRIPRDETIRIALTKR